MESQLKIFFGWLLLLLGVAVIGLALFASYQIFTAQKEIPQIFALSEENIYLGSQKQELNLEQMVAQSLSEQIKSMFPRDAIVKLLNLSAWTMGSGLFIFGGSKISQIGINLLRSSGRKERINNY